MRKQFSALKEYFRKLPDSDKNIAKNARYKRIMTLLTSPETMVQFCFLESVKPIFDKFLESFQVEGPLIHNLYPCMVLLLKQMMSQFLKPKVLQKKTVADSQLKDSELEIGLPTRQALIDVKNSGMQKQCYLGIRTFFTETLTYMQKSLALRNPLTEALTCLHPAKKAKITSVEKIRKVGDSLPCIKPEELIVLTDEWRISAETDIPEEWAQKDGSAVRVDQYWSKVLKLKSVSGSQKFSMLGKVIKCALSLSHGNADNERSLSINKNTLSKETSSLSITTLNGLRAVEDGVIRVNEGGLSNVAVNKGMLVSGKSSHKAYLAHIEEERKNEDSQKRKSSEEKQQEREAKRRKEEELKKIDGLRKNTKELDERESKAFEMLKSACAFLEEGSERMAKGVADKNMNEIEATQKIIELAQEKQKKSKA